MGCIVAMSQINIRELLSNPTVAERDSPAGMVTRIGSNPINLPRESNRAEVTSTVRGLEVKFIIVGNDTSS